MLRQLSWIFQAIIYDIYVAIMRALPIDVASYLGGTLLKTIGPLTSKQKTVLINLKLAFHTLNSEQLKVLALKQWEQFGRTTAEFPIMDKIKKDVGRIKIEGLEYLDYYKTHKKPFVVVSMHQANWELVPIVILGQNIPFLVTYRAANNPYVDKRIREGRRRYGVKLFGSKGNDGAKELLLALSNGDSVGLMNDQKFNRGVVTKFFDTLVETAPGPSRLALRFNTDIIPISVARLNGARFIVTIHKPIYLEKDLPKSKAIEAAAQRITNWVETVIISAPYDWFWVHKRWPASYYKPLDDIEN